MNWERNLDKHIVKTIKNIDSFAIENKNKDFMKTSFLLADTTLRIFIASVLNASGSVIKNDVGWTKRLKKLPLESYQEALSILMYSYLENTDETKDYSSLFDKKFLMEGLNLTRFDSALNLPRCVLDALAVDSNIDNEFVISTLNHLVGGYLERMDIALLRIYETLKNETTENTKEATD